MRRIAIPATVLILAAQATCALAQTARLETNYSIYLTGLQIARGFVNVEFSETGFTASGSAKTSGFIRIISKSEGSTNVRATLRDGRVISSTFNGHYVSSRRQQKIDLSVENGSAKQISIEPAPPEHDESRVPITNSSKMNIVDPLSAMLAFVPAKGEMLSPENCNRTLPIFDGRYRFNIVLSYARIDNGIKAEGYRGPALVCRARYVPIAGHRDRETVQQMAENRDMYVWLAPVAGTRVLAPIKASIASPIGTFVVEATRFQASGG